MATTIGEIATTIGEHGSLGTAALQFGNNSTERRMLTHDLKAYRKETTDTSRWLPRNPRVVYSDADLCVFQLTTDEESPLVYKESSSNREVPVWWLLGRDELRECGLVLMEFPADNVDDTTALTRSDVLGALDLDSWQTISREQATKMEVGASHRLSGRLGIKRYDPDDWIEMHDKTRERDRLGVPRTTTRNHSDESGGSPAYVRGCGRSGSHVQSNARDRYCIETAYIPAGSAVYTVSDDYHNREVTLSEASTYSGRLHTANRTPHVLFETLSKLKFQLFRSLVQH